MVNIFVWGLTMVIAFKVALLAGAFYLISMILGAPNLPSNVPTPQSLSHNEVVVEKKSNPMVDKMVAFKHQMDEEKKIFMQDCLSVMANDEKYCNEVFKERLLGETQAFIEELRASKE